MKPIRSRWIAALIRLSLCAGLPGHARAFYADGFWSGMSAQQFAFAASAQGLTAQPGADGAWYLGAADPPQVLGRAGFCGDILVSYTRAILSDADYASVLAQIFSAYGPPRKLQFGGDVEPDAAAGAFRANALTLWAQGADRVVMNSTFDWRLYGGALFRQQPASVTFEMRNPCGG